MPKIEDATSLPIVERRNQGRNLPRRDDPEQEQPKQSKREATREAVTKAVAKLRRARAEAGDGLDYLLAVDTNDVSLVRRRPDGRTEVIRTIEADEVLRLAQLLDAGRQQLLDRKV
jgi:uncharacterized FlaG/YvyC family protein